MKKPKYIEPDDYFPSEIEAWYTKEVEAKKAAREAAANKKPEKKQPKKK